jgi:hypothetical protein
VSITISALKPTEGEKEMKLELTTIKTTTGYTITTDHAASSYGIPVIIDPAGNVYSKAEYIARGPVELDTVAFPITFDMGRVPDLDDDNEIAWRRAYGEWIAAYTEAANELWGRL